MKTVFLVAGEVSGDLQAAELALELRRRSPSLILTGVGGPRMTAAGVQVLLNSTTWGVIGYVDPLLRLRAYLRRLREVESAIRAQRPEALVLVDFAAFNLRLAERLRGLVPVAYYFPPMVSVRKGDRARKVARLRMRLLATLRREADAYAAAGADVVFVGHPAADLPRRAPEPAEARHELGIAAGAPVVGLLPGSRLQEIRAHLPVLLASAAELARIIPDVTYVLPVPAPEIHEAVAAHVAAATVPVRVTSEVYAALRASDVLVASTGTATLEAAVLGVPMVAVYRLPWLSWVIVRRILTIRYAALPNLLAGREIVPELLQDRMTPAGIAAAVAGLLQDPARRAAMRRDLLAVAATLGEPGAAGRAAEEVLRLMGHVASAEA